MSRMIRNLALLALVLGLAGCQTVKGVGTRIDRALDKVMGSKGQRLDPWESWNRKVFAFNESLDANVLKPVATAYSEIVPSPIRTGIDNFFGNIGDAWSAVNLVLQGRFKAGVEQGMRFFRDEAFLEEATARREAERGTFDPTYLVYSIGKLMMLKLRRDYKEQQGGRYSLRPFHDAVLAQGCAPFPAHRQLLLERDMAPALE